MKRPLAMGSGAILTTTSAGVEGFVLSAPRG
jgi:hypothetical protein